MSQSGAMQATKINEFVIKPFNQPVPTSMRNFFRYECATRKANDFEQNFLLEEDIARTVDLAFVPWLMDDDNESPDRVALILDSIYKYDIDNVCFCAMRKFNTNVIRRICSIINANQKRHDQLLFNNCHLTKQNLHDLCNFFRWNEYIKYISFENCTFFVDCELSLACQCKLFASMFLLLLKKCPNLLALNIEDLHSTDFSNNLLSPRDASSNNTETSFIKFFKHIAGSKIAHLDIRSKRHGNLFTEKVQMSNVLTLGHTIKNQCDDEEAIFLQQLPNLENLLLDRTPGIFCNARLTDPTELFNVSLKQLRLKSILLSGHFNEQFSIGILRSLQEQQLTRIFCRVSFRKQIVQFASYVERMSNQLVALEFSYNGRVESELDGLMQTLAQSQILLSLEYNKTFDFFAKAITWKYDESWWLQRNTALLHLQINQTEILKLQDRNRLLVASKRRVVFTDIVLALWPILHRNVYVYLWLISFLDPYNVLKDCIVVADLQRIVEKIDNVCDKKSFFAKMK